jgi:hypothetical protein
VEFDQNVYDFCKRALSPFTRDHELFTTPHPYVKDMAFGPSFGWRKDGPFIIFPSASATQSIWQIENLQYTESFHDWPLIKFHLELIALEQEMARL